jgi:hypothetical protein
VKKVVTTKKAARATKKPTKRTKVSKLEPRYPKPVEAAWVFVGAYKDNDLYARSNPPETKRTDRGYVYWSVSVTEKLNSNQEIYNKSHATARRLAHKMGLEGF